MNTNESEHEDNPLRMIGPEWPDLVPETDAPPPDWFPRSRMERAAGERAEEIARMLRYQRDLELVRRSDRDSLGGHAWGDEGGDRCAPVSPEDRRDRTGEYARLAVMAVAAGLICGAITWTGWISGAAGVTGWMLMLAVCAWSWREEL